MISPLDIRQHSFKKSLRGYDAEDVRSFLISLSQEWESVLMEHKTLKIDLEKTRESLASYKEMESILHKTLLQAEQSTKSVMESAQRDAELKMQEAEQRAQQIVQAAMLDADMKKQEAEQQTAAVLNKAYEERSKVEQEMNDLIHRRHDIIHQMNLFLRAQLDRLKTFEQREAIVLEASNQIDRGFQPRPTEMTEPQAIVNGAKTAEQAPRTPHTSFFDTALPRTERAALINALAEEL